MLESKEDELRWELLKRNPEYRRAYNEFILDKEETCVTNAELEEVFLKRWGLESVRCPEDDYTADLKFRPMILEKIISKADAQFLAYEEESEHSGQPIQVTTPFYDFADQISGSTDETDKRFSLLLFDLTMFSNTEEIMENIKPIIQSQFKKVSTLRKDRKSITEIKEAIKLVDEFYKLSKKENLPPLEYISEASLTEYLSKVLSGGKMFKSYLADEWNHSHPNNAQKEVLRIFRFVRQAPFIVFK